MRWIVRADDGATVGDVLARARADAGAVRDGRVFVGRRRVRSEGEGVRDGDVVEVAPPRDSAPPEVPVLAKTSDLVVVDKPAGLPTIADQAGASHTLVALAARAIGVDPSQLHPTSRLDRGVSGVVVLARTKGAAARLVEARAKGAYERRYVALTCATPGRERGVWDAPIGRAPDPRLRLAHGRDAVPARTLYAVCATAPSGRALLALGPVTGRTHQIRVHAAHAQAPIFGDRAYGAPARVTLPGGRVVELERIALHAARVVVPDVDGSPLEVRAPIPRELAGLWSSFEGQAEAWERATSCALP